MKKIIAVIVGVVILGAGGYFFISRNLILTTCLHGESMTTWYFDKQFISNSESEIFSKSVAAHASGCADKYKIKDGDSLREVSKNEFKSFLQEYNSNCNNCVAYKGSGLTPFQGYYDYATKQLIYDPTSASKNANTKTVFQFNKPFVVSGVPLPETNFPPRYTSNEILEKSLVTIRAVQFWSNACDRGTMPADICPVKNEQMVRISFSVAESEGASWHVKEHYFTDKTLKIQEYEGYQLEVMSIDSVNKQATIVIGKIGGN